MKVLLQRVSQAAVRVDSEVVGEIGEGLLLLVGVAACDERTVVSPLAKKVAQLRVFPDERGRFHYSLLDTGGGALCVSQFTLCADTNKGRRPDFNAAMKPPGAEDLFEAFVAALREQGVQTVETGSFGAHMEVSLINDGPVTILLESF